ncbi:MAG: beta-propeller domain-containing protein [Candidatus Bathyarchaeia archaeon]|jgi:uncharacterized secreted protein with C-terminal beta-propeller domain
MVQRELKSKTRLYALAAVLSAVVLIGAIYTVTMPTVMYGLTGISPMKNFASTDEIRNYLTANTQGDTVYYNGGPLDDVRSSGNTEGSFTVTGPVGPVGPTGPAGAIAGDKAPSAQSPTLGIAFAGDTQEYSTTNVQVTGVDEADTVKTDGKYIYTLNTNYTTEPANKIEIINADAQDPSVVGEISFNSETSIAGMYLSQNGNKLAVLGSNYGNMLFFPTTRVYGEISVTSNYVNVVKTFIYVYDVSNKAEPALTRNLTLSGSYFNSRMIGNYVYTVVSQQAYANNETVILPQICTNTVSKDVAPTDIYYTYMQDSYFSYNTFAGLNIMDDSQEPTDMTILMGGSSCMYVSTSNMYVTFPDNTGESTEIYRVAINGANLSFEAKGIVPGYILNQYSMDEYNNYFRVATTVSTGSWVNRDQHNNLYVLNMNLEITGKVENLAQGEQIYSARFAGDKAYLVTFKQVDPFFVLDLKDPTNPKVAGELKIPGYSSYLHPYNENYVIGLGKENSTVKLSLFDVTDMNNPTEIAKYVIGENADYAESTALYEPKAFLFDQQKQLLVIPVSITDYSYTQPLPDSEPKTSNSSDISSDKDLIVPRMQISYWQGAYVFKLSPDNGFVLQGQVSHQTDDNNQNLYWSYGDTIERSLYIGNTLYTVSNMMVQLNSLDDLGLIAQVQF